MKVGILTWHYYRNYGSALQAYALQEIIRKYGYDVKILNYRNKAIEVQHPFKNSLKILLSFLFKYKFDVEFLKFQRKFLHQTKVICSKEQLVSIIDEFETVVCGSDQIWAPNVFNPIYMFDGVVDHVKKISYAASIGLDKIPDNLVPRYSQLLRKFSVISVRESTGQRLLKQACNIESTVVLDPTLLLQADCWRTIECKPKITESNFIFCYFLNKNHGYKGKVQIFASQHHLKIVGVSNRIEDEDWMEIPENVGPSEFLWLIDHCRFVFTDSYHGSIFSMLFHKKWVTFERFKSTDPVCQNSRIKELADDFKIQKQIHNIDTYDPHVVFEYDFDIFEKHLNGLRRKSEEFLQDSL